MTADEWNASNPPGTPVVLERVDGQHRLSRTAGLARLVGQFVMVPVENGSLWMLAQVRRAVPGVHDGVPWL